MRIDDQENIELVRQLVQAHAYWRIKGLTVDLVIWNEDPSGYRQNLQDQIMGLIAAGSEAQIVDRPGGIFVRRPDQMSDEDRTLLQTVARVIVDDKGGTLADQLERRGRLEPRVPRFLPLRNDRAETAVAADDAAARPVVLQRVRRLHPRWPGICHHHRRGDSNARAVGQCAGESLLRYGRLGERRRIHLVRKCPRVPPDALVQRPRERLERRSLLRPRRRVRPVLVADAAARARRHAVRQPARVSATASSSTPRMASRTELWVYVATDAPVKFAVLKLRNESGRPRRLSATAYCEWVLGDLRPRSLMYVTTEVDPRTGAVFARNPSATDFAGRVAFLDANDAARSVTGDRTEFLGRNGTTASPAAMTRTRLSGRVGAALDPCAAMQVTIDLAAGQEHEICFILGIGRDADDARNLIQRFRGSAAARRALESVWQYWNHTLGAVNVDTPDPSVNFLANGWLLYQTLACRVWGAQRLLPVGRGLRFPRPASGRDGARCTREPRLLREHLLRCAVAPVPRGRRPALVAPARRPRRAHAFLRRLPVAAAGDLPLRRGHRRYRRARRAHPVPRAAAR